ncbi:hypothetical protein PAQ31011_05095 [Pandoraea aquatica]|uniref:DUF6966 domain-containing protein n=1 Tax=Pandoraea aquatica TaxID=2508290 RepID=A0A5E4Z6B9_9BURK|nr:hypothetical protein [Pandoraea aquatica]VVE56288.1 hypothetical protein PAQ31011_05095 [Pandoraea aquatica]
MTNVKEIQRILLRMSELLTFSGRDDWASSISHLADKADEGYSSVRPEIRQMYGGMGSLNDIVLYKDGNLLREENDEFDALRHRLHELTRG